MPLEAHPDLLALAADLTALTRDGGNGNRLTVAMGPAWLVVRGVQGGDTLDVEAAARFYLPETVKVGAEGVGLLRRQGFAKKPGARNLARTVKLVDQDQAALASSFIDVLVNAYGQDPNAPVARSLQLGDAEPTRNDGLVDGMRKLSKDRSPRQRNQVYSLLLRGRLLVPVDASGDLEVFGEITGMPVYGVFTDWGALLGWDPRGHDIKVVPGRQLFPSLMRTRVGSLLINPQGQVGGELYRNEIAAIADVAERR